MEAKTRVAILGASGYTGAELVRLLVPHPFVEIKALVADRRAGQSMASVCPQFAMLDLPMLSSLDELDCSQIDLIFAALPHATTQEVVKALPQTVKIVDLSADFRLSDPAVYAQWYGQEHRAVALQSQAVYGLSEICRHKIEKARLVANPGCYPTSILLPLIPLLEAGAIQTDDLICDAKSAVSGAGRAPKEASLFAEVSGGIHAYGVSRHRHAPEIEQQLAEAAGKPVVVNFTPHLMPMKRGILSTCYVKLVPGKTAEDLHAILVRRYHAEPFVHILPWEQTPQTRHVSGSNHVMIGLCADRLPGRAIIVSVIDNLVKGAAGQAVQNMNLMQGWPETAALEQLPLFP